MTTIELAAEVGLTGKSIRMAIHRGDLRATRISKGLGQTASATEFVITRAEADDWKRRRTARKTGVPCPEILEEQKRRRQENQHAYFQNHDDEMDDGKMEKLKREALQGDARAKARICLPWEQGGLGVTVWLRAGIGGVV